MPTLSAVKPMTGPDSAQVLPTIVGIGASAGGLEALRDVASNLPSDSGCAFVIVQHMAPLHESLLTRMISSETDLTVSTILDDTRPVPNTIYVAPPGRDVVLDGDVLRLLRPPADRVRPSPSVDKFFLSLADVMGKNCLAVVLSGNGSDGAIGVEAIREVGGITIAQDGLSAKFDSMSNASVKTGCIDLVLTPTQIGSHLSEILASPSGVRRVREASTRGSSIPAVLQIVLAHTGVDFRDYKPAMVQRRIDLRMSALELKSTEDYVAYCRRTPSEVEALFNDMLVSVTRFFREPGAFGPLKDTLKDMVRGRVGRPMRIWVPGCATGEEAYSIAILLAEALGGPAALLKSGVQIFATDIDTRALAYGRKGIYRNSELVDVPDAYRETYFTQLETGGRAEVSEALRSVVVFSYHNICKDPPLLHIDMISCRNVLIYFSTKLQNRVLSRLHYALSVEGALFLGLAETVASTERLFKPLVDDARIFVKQDVRERATPSQLKITPNSVAPQGSAPPATPGDQGLEHGLLDAMLKAHGERVCLVDKDHEVRRVIGDVTELLTPQSSTDHRGDDAAQFQLRMLKAPIHDDARTLVGRALETRSRCSGKLFPIVTQASQAVQLDAVALDTADMSEPLVLLRFTFVPLGEPSTEAANTQLAVRSTTLDEELARTRHALQCTIEQLETSNRELKSLSHDMHSTNVELQEANHELATSNEDLQFTNEELITVNEELQINGAELQSLNAELGSVLGNVPLPLMVLNAALQITRASRSAMTLFDIPETALRPHLSQIHMPKGFPQLVDLCARSLETRETVILDFSTNDGAFSLRAAPFTNSAGQLIGTTLILLSAPKAQ